MIHPTALIDSQAKLAPDVRVGPFAVIEGAVTLDAGCVIHGGAYLKGPLTMGAKNVVHATATIGDWPQDRKFHGEHSETIIGDDNVFREGVTVHRGTGAGTKTIIGSRGYFMVHAHVGHNCIVADDVTMINGSALGGFAQVEPRAIIGAHCSIHQFCRVGRLAMLSDAAGASVDIPPFCIVMLTNQIVQLNLVGLRRSGTPRENITALRRMFQLLFRSNHLLGPAIDDLPAEICAVPEVQEFIAFCRGSKRGIARFQAWSGRRGAGSESPNA